MSVTERMRITTSRELALFAQFGHFHSVVIAKSLPRLGGFFLQM